MAKSRETYNQNQDKGNKGKKKNEKEQRRQERRERKANKGNTSFEDMLAYVDEDGNITSTPPDPTKKKVIREEDIEIGVPKQDKTKIDPTRKGKVTFFNDSKGFGFIRDSETQESIFVHVKSLLDPIRENDLVSFEVERGPKGLNAVRVKKA